MSLILLVAVYSLLYLCLTSNIQHQKGHLDIDALTSKMAKRIKLNRMLW